MTQEKKSLGEIVTESFLKGVISYPLYAALGSAIKPETFVEKLTDKETLYFSLGFMTANLFYEAGKRVYQSYKEKSLSK